jgi:serralysin
MSLDVIQQATEISPINIFFPVTGSLANGDYVIAYSFTTSDFFTQEEIFATVFDPSGHPVGTSTVTQQFGFVSPYLSLGELSGGGYALAWDSNTELFQTGIGTETFNSDGSPLSSRQDLAFLSSPNESEPTVTPLADGGYAVSWVAFPMLNNSQLVTETFGPHATGPTQVSNVPANGGVTFIAHAASASGGYALAWRQGVPGDSQIYFTTFDPQGNEINAPIDITQNVTSDTGFSAPRMTALSDGDYALVWDSQTDATIGTFLPKVWTAIYDGNGNQVVAPEIVDQIVGLPTIASLGRSEYAVAWEGSDGKIYTTVYDAQGHQAFAPLEVSHEAGQAPQIVALSNGDYAVAWVNATGGISTAVVGPQGHELAGPVVVADATNGDASFSQREPALTALANGEYVITWMSPSTDPLNPLELSSAIYQFSDNTGSVVDITYVGTGESTLDLSNIVDVGGNVTISDNLQLDSVNLGNVVNVGGNVTINGNLQVDSLNLGNVVNVGGNVTINGNLQLDSVNLGNVVNVGGSVTVSGDLSATDVNMASLDTVGGNVTIESGADAALDASALGPGGGTVRLIGDNLTTTIELGSLDHLSGLLTITSADGVLLTSHAGLAVLNITGTAHDDILIGSATAKNIIDGGLGNDALTGGAADDSFIFDFSISQHTEDRDVTHTVHHHDFVSLANVRSIVIDGAVYSKPALTASITAWKAWDNALIAYANKQPDNNGGDDFMSFTNSNPGNASKTVGTIQLIDGYYHNHDTNEVQHQSVTVTDLAGSGFDTIANFANQSIAVSNGGTGNDTLLFKGLSTDPAALNYWGNWLDSTTAGGNTTIHFHDIAHNGADVSAITLLGTTTDVATLVHDNIIQFQHTEWAI